MRSSGFRAFRSRVAAVGGFGLFGFGGFRVLGVTGFISPRVQVPNNHILSQILTYITTILNPST